MSEYTEQANVFMAKTGTIMDVRLLGHFKYFDDDKAERDVYEVTLTRNGIKYTFRFGQSIAHSNTKELRDKIKLAFGPDRIRLQKQIKTPTAYDVLASITKNDPGTFSDFCLDFGYDEDSRKAEKTYFAVQEEYKNIRRLFHDVMTELQEIA